MKRLFALVLCVMGLSFASVATAQEGGDGQQSTVASRVEALLGGIEYVPTADDWKKIGPEAADELRKIANDPSEAPSVRSRAISSLSHFPSAVNKDFLGKMLADKAQSSLLRRKALRSLSAGYGAESMELVGPYLKVEDKRLRESAIKALGSMKTVEAKTVLQERLSLEKAAYLKEMIQKSLQ